MAGLSPSVFKNKKRHQYKVSFLSSPSGYLLLTKCSFGLFWDFCGTMHNSTTNCCMKNTQNGIKKWGCGRFFLAQAIDSCTMIETPPRVQPHFITSSSVVRRGLWNSVAGLMNSNKVDYLPPPHPPKMEKKLKIDSLCTHSPRQITQKDRQQTV